LKINSNTLLVSIGVSEVKSMNTGIIDLFIVRPALEAPHNQGGTTAMRLPARAGGRALCINHQARGHPVQIRVGKPGRLPPAGSVVVRCCLGLLEIPDREAKRLHHIC
jgi:DNA-binding IclR family transcriptional regulator